jgi:MoxR-like ATPase
MKTDPKAETANKEVEMARSVVARLENRLKRVIKGRDDVIDLLLIAILSDGHVLLQDYPGSGKTTLAKCLGDSIIDDISGDEIPGFRRIQFTPDLLPSDITGVSIFDAATATFHFRRGPIFAYIVLGDEINRTSPKVQSAMLEAMAEKQVTVDNVSYPLNDLFFVVATQNPRDVAGTYPLPVAQLDRFLFEIRMDYIDRESEIEVLTTRLERRDIAAVDLPRVKRSEIVAARDIIERSVRVHPHIHSCLVDIARSIRADKRVVQGISTRSLVLLVPALKAAAMMHHRDYVSAEDVARLAPYAFTHRVSLAPGAGDEAMIVSECIKAPLETLSRYTLAGE